MAVRHIAERHDEVSVGVTAQHIPDHFVALDLGIYLRIKTCGAPLWPYHFHPIGTSEICPYLINYEFSCVLQARKKALRGFYRGCSPFGGDIKNSIAAVLPRLDDIGPPVRVWISIPEMKSAILHLRRVPGRISCVVANPPPVLVAPQQLIGFRVCDMRVHIA